MNYESAQLRSEIADLRREVRELRRDHEKERSAAFTRTMWWIEVGIWVCFAAIIALIAAGY